MEHYYQSVKGWCNFGDYYKQIVTNAAYVSKFVEVGTWKGMSACCMGVELINANKNIEFTCIDTFLGSKEHDPHDKDNDGIYTEFLENIEPIKSIVKHIRSTSEAAAPLFTDNSLDFVFLDASHEYEDVYRDIQVWLPKVTTGGILAGHDLCASFPGVRKAVESFFSNKFTIHEGNVWQVIK